MKIAALVLLTATSTVLAACGGDLAGAGQSAATDAPAALIAFDSPVSFNVITLVFEDLVGTTKHALAQDEAARELEQLRAQVLAEGAALMVSALGASRSERGCTGGGCRDVFLRLESYAPGAENLLLGVFAILGSGDPSQAPEVGMLAPDEASDVALTVLLPAPVAYNTLLVSLEDQSTSLTQALAVDEAAELTAALRESLVTEGAALMVPRFGSPLPGSYCRINLCRDTYVELERYRPGEDSLPVAMLSVRNFVDPSRPDVADVSMTGGDGE